MIEVIPAILDESFQEMSNHIASVLDIAPLAQIDFCDGKFVPSRTWPYATGGLEGDPHMIAILAEEDGMPFWEKIDFEFHLMVERAHDNLDTFLRLGPKSLVFQLEAEGDLGEFKEFLEGIDPYVRDTVNFGIAINTRTPVADVLPLIPFVDFVQCMGIAEIGVQGQPFDERVFDVIKELQKSYPDLIIAVDGSVNRETAPRLVDAGVKRLIIGSALLKSNDIAEAMYEYQHLDS